MAIDSEWSHGWRRASAATPVVSASTAEAGARRLIDSSAAGYGRGRWDGGLYTALDYLTGAANAGDPGGRLVRRLKARDPAVPALAARLILKGLVAHERQLRRHGPRVEIIPAPGHEPGPAGSPLHHIRLELTAAAPWLYYRPGRLVRATEIRSSRASTHRPSIDEHLATLVCVGRPMVGSIIIDDVFTYGNSSEACRAVLRGRRTQTLAIACLARAGG